MPREYDYQDIEVRFGDLRVPGDLDRVPYQGQFLPPSYLSPNLARDVELFATEWWRHYAPVAVRLDISLRGSTLELTATGAPGGSRTVTVPLHEFELDVYRSVESALIQLLQGPTYDMVQPPMRLPWMAALDAAVREVHVEGTISLKDPEPAPEPPRPRKTFWEIILEEE